jgi:trk system potassium uptake protein TrkA
MRAVFVGAGTLTVMTARILLERGDEVVVVERDKERIDELAETLDCGFVHGDGSTPAILAETNPKEADFLFCLTDHDQANILTALVGRSLGFRRQVTRIANPEYEHICLELGLEDTIIPSRTIAHFLADTAQGQDALELSAMIKNGARVFTFVAGEDQAVAVSELALPEDTRIVCIYRGDAFLLPDGDTRLEEEDEVVLITHHERMEEVAERFGPRVEP